APDQIQTLATESFEAQLDAQRELRSYALGRKNVEYPRVQALMVIMKYGGRWLDLAGFNPKKENHEQLIFKRELDPNAEDTPDVLPRLSECAPGDRDRRPPTEFDPPPAAL